MKRKKSGLILFALPLTFLLGYLLTGCQSLLPGKSAKNEALSSPEPVLVWEGKQGDKCYTVAIDAQGQAQFGACSGPLSTGLISSDMERPEDLRHFLDSFQPFEANTFAGRINFLGHGVNSAKASEQRAIAEWASIVYYELLYGRGSASWGMGIALNREGDNPCQLIQIEIDGKVMANDCRDGIHPYPRIWLTVEQLDRLYGWIDRFQAAELNFQSEDGQPMRFVFGGKGNQAVTDVELKEMLGWVERIYERVQ